MSQIVHGTYLYKATLSGPVASLGGDPGYLM